jgi:hypothetical protein
MEFFCLMVFRKNEDTEFCKKCPSKSMEFCEKSTLKSLEFCEITPSSHP